MINSASSINVQSNVQGRDIEMSIDANSLTHIMGVLTNLYSDPELAVIREYSTNALDGQNKNGVTNPIEVTLPSPLSPVFRVKDRGIGLSVDDIHNIYSKYGASGSRNSNDAVGMFGLGSKSALTYANQFTVVSVKDGVKVTVSVQRNEQGGGTMTIVDTRTTTEHSGVEIIVPTKQDNTFAYKAEHFFSFWAPGTVLVNGQAPKPVETLLKVSDAISIIKGYKSYLVMGNVPYPVNRISGLPYNYGTIIRVPIGSVNLTPSRESLHYTALTKSVIDTASNRLQAGLGQALSDELQKVPSRFEVIQWMRERKDLIKSSHGLTYRGLVIPTSLQAEDTHIWTISEFKGPLSRKFTSKTLDASFIPDTLFVTGFTQGFSGAVKKRLLAYCEGRGIVPTRFVLTGGSVDKTWLDETMIVDWPSIKRIKLPRSTTATTTGLGGAYEVYVGSESTVLSSDDIMDLGLPIFHIAYDRDASYGYAHEILALEYGADYVLVPLKGNRVEKFLRVVTEAVAISDEIQRLRQNVLKSVSEDVKIALHIKTNGIDSQLRGLRNLAVNDPKISSAMRYLDVDTSDVLKKLKALNVSNHFDVSWENPLNAYPLLPNLRWATPEQIEHSVIYINAIYAA